MERHEVLAMMTKLKLAGMRTAYDDILADGLKRRHPVQQIIGALLKAEIADKTARSIKYQMASREAAGGQGAGRVRLRRLAGQRAPDPRPQPGSSSSTPPPTSGWPDRVSPASRGALPLRRHVPTPLP